MITDQHLILSILEASPDGIVITDKGGFIAKTSQSAAKMFGYDSSADAQGMNILNFISPDEHKLVHECIKLMLSGDNGGAKEYTGIRKDGSSFDIEISNNVITEESGEAAGFIFITRDITEKKRAAESVKRENSLMDAIFESVPGMIYLYDHEGKLIRWNKKHQMITGYSQEELSNKHVMDWFEGNPESIKTIKEGIRRAFEEGFGEVEANLKKKDGTWVPMYFTASGVEIDGKQHLAGIGVDLSDQKERERELVIAKERAQESDRLKTAFLQNISHEVRTPLNSIMGFLEIINDSETSEASRKEYMQIVSLSSRRLLSIITDIISISALQTGQERCVYTDVPLNSVCKLLYEDFNIFAIEKSIHFKLLIPREETVIKSDESKLVQILGNLLSNAFKFTDSGEVVLGYEKRAEYVDFFVKDTGYGIPENMKKDIFDSFRQGHLELNRKYEGSGLGLSIAKAYAGMLGGQITVESSEGSGSLFSLSIPIKSN